MKNIYINVEKDEMCGYSVSVNGEVMLECLAEDEVEALTIEELAKMYNQYKTEK